MDASTLLIILAIVNIPTYAFIAWIMFDDIRNAQSSILSGLLHVLLLLVSGSLFLRAISSDNSNSLFNLVVVIGGCIGIVGVQFWLLAIVMFPDYFNVVTPANVG